MIPTKLNSLESIERIKPVAYLSGDLSGVKLIVQLPNNQYAFLIPPSYEIAKTFSKNIFESAVSKHGYTLIVGDHILHSEEELKIFLKWFQKK